MNQVTLLFGGQTYDVVSASDTSVQALGVAFRAGLSAGEGPVRQAFSSAFSSGKRTLTDDEVEGLSRDLGLKVAVVKKHQPIS